MVTYSYPKVNYSDLMVTSPLTPYPSNLTWARSADLLSIMRLQGGGGGKKATNFSVSSRQGFKL